MQAEGEPVVIKNQNFLQLLDYLSDDHFVKIYWYLCPSFSLKLIPQPRIMQPGRVGCTLLYRFYCCQ